MNKKDFANLSTEALLAAYGDWGFKGVSSSIGIFWSSIYFAS